MIIFAYSSFTFHTFEETTAINRFKQTFKGDTLPVHIIGGKLSHCNSQSRHSPNLSQRRSERATFKNVGTNILGASIRDLYFNRPFEQLISSDK